MASKFLILNVLIVLVCRKVECDQKIDNEDFGNFAELAADLFQQQGGAQGLNNVMQGFMGSALSGMLAGGVDSPGGSGSNLGQVLKGLGNMVGPNAQGIDTNVISGIMGMIGNSLDPAKKSDEGVDVMSVLSSIGGALVQPENADKIDKFSGYIPMVVDFMSQLYGPEAKEREKRHAEHSWFLPPIMEKFHILFDHFTNSEFGKKIMEAIGAEKVVKIFSDEMGNFSYDKFVELIENHSFRRHWIHMLTLRIGKLIERYADPKVYKQFAGTAEVFINGYIQSRGFPKSVLFKSDAPASSMAALIDYFSKTYFGTKINSMYYISPIVHFATDIFNMMKKESTTRGGTEGISAKIADSINLEIIEPVARVNRAYRFLKKNPRCDKYVLCLVNQRGPETDSFPGLKLLLSRGTSFVASWALSSQTGESMTDYISMIMYEDQCQKFFKSECGDYHGEEERVTTEYIHNEL